MAEHHGPDRSPAEENDGGATRPGGPPAGLRPSFQPRAPYLFHFDDQTVALGDPEFLRLIETDLISAGLATRTTFWDQAYLDGEDGEPFAPDPDPENINSVGIQGDEDVFWSAMESALFARAEWPQEDTATVYFPEYPQWLRNAQSWSFDPVCPPLGPANPGGWVRRRGVAGAGHPIGLFQLTDDDSFWVLGAEEDLEAVVDLCASLARFRRGFDALTGYRGPDDVLGSLALPLICREPLHEELMIRGVDVETLFWN